MWGRVMCPYLLWRLWSEIMRCKTMGRVFWGGFCDVRLWGGRRGERLWGCAMGWAPWGGHHGVKLGRGHLGVGTVPMGAVGWHCHVG